MIIRSLVDFKDKHEENDIGKHIRHIYKGCLYQAKECMSGCYADCGNGDVYLENGEFEITVKIEL